MGQLLKSLRTGAAMFVAVSLLFIGMLSPMAAHVAAVNNGTLKVHEIGTPRGTESNDPKVCAFNFEGFNFDPSLSGYLQLDPQGGSVPLGVAAGPFNFGPTDATGYAISEDFNNGAGTTTISDGTYKATLYGKKGNGSINLQDDKAKSKVFKVDCAGAATPVTPADVTFADSCGTAGDTYTIPTTTGVLYQIGGNTVAAGTYAGSGTVTVTAVADTGYTLTGTTSWQHTFTDVVCPATPVTPSDVTFNDVCSTANDTYTIPSTNGVTYQIGGNTVAAGTYPGSGTVTVNAVANAGFTLTGTTSWTHDFTNDPCPVQVTPGDVTFNDACGTAGDTYTIPSTAGVLYQIGGNTVAAGTYAGSGTVTVTAVADTGYTLTGTSSWTHDFTNVPCPPNAAIPTAPTFVDLTCNKAGSYTIPSVTGVIYKVNGVVAAAGTYNVLSPTTVNITAEADTGYVLSGTSSWSFTFHAPSNCGLILSLTTPTVATGQTLSATTTKELVNTGSSALLSLFISLFLISTTAALHFSYRTKP